MNRWQTVALAGAALSLAAVAGYWWGGRDDASAPSPAGPEAGTERKILYYRNPMGLPDTSPVPKKDPMGMDYVPVYEGDTDTTGSMPAGTVRISLDKVQLLGVRTEVAGPRLLTRTVHAVGTVQANERRLYKVAPRFEGWIEKLHVNATGQAVRLGQALMEVYSPELVATQEEYLIALRAVKETAESSSETRAVMQRVADSVLRRLKNYEVSERELEALQRDGAPQRRLVYRSAASGVVLRKPSIEGMRFMPGEVLYEIADLSTVWVLADVFEQELALVHAGQEAKLRITAYPDKEFTGKVAFIYPTLDPETRTARIRIELPNPAMLLKPAMYGNVEFAAGHPRAETLAIPDTAVLDSGTRRAVLVRRGEGLFEPREIRTGTRGDGYVEVVEGLTSGEEVVVRANFLIDAESNLKSALGSFGGHGGHGGKPAAETEEGPSGHEAHGQSPPKDAPSAQHSGH